ncbi:hypothetical protein CAC42_2111 [Sphaceloma murrayae]|uniref:Uncharacterized protein n=1 Tax=Sphaceloma murrayae TaxID=2082308 RepID=A0A2K1QJ08_9PEZI|nr:hypothetical protein CAC42_2111 [Sphaceloma murrayae]
MSHQQLLLHFNDDLKHYYKAKEDYYQFVGLGGYKNTPLPPNLDKPSFTAIMPVLPQEENTTGNLTDQVAKESSDSTASSHDMHKVGEQTKATVQDHKANPGIAMTDKLPEAASKDDLKKRAEELNKK